MGDSSVFFLRALGNSQTYENCYESRLAAYPQGLKPIPLIILIAALKRRSSTEIPALCCWRSWFPPFENREEGPPWVCWVTAKIKMREPSHMFRLFSKIADRSPHNENRVVWPRVRSRL